MLDLPMSLTTLWLHYCQISRRIGYSRNLANHQRPLPLFS
jgi:hypothetical protein